VFPSTAGNSAAGPGNGNVRAVRRRISGERLFHEWTSRTWRTLVGQAGLEPAATVDAMVRAVQAAK
jgi:hypothetical protein